MPKARTKRTTRRREAVEPAAIISASIQHNDTLDRMYAQQSPDTALVARAIGTVYNAADTNATVVAGQQIRLYRPAGGASKLWPGRKVARKTADFLRGRTGLRQDSKASGFASAADDIEEVLEHPALDVMARPDPRTTGDNWSWLVAFWQEITGRAYLYKGERALGSPVSLYPLGPQYTIPIGSKTEFISHYRYGRDSAGTIAIPAADVVYVRQRVHPSNPLSAISWAHAVVLPMEMESAALQSEVARWTNGGQPGGVIELPPNTTPKQYDQVMAQIDSKYKGVNKAGTWLVLQNAKVTNYASKPHEMAYKDGLMAAQEIIYRAAGIPESVWKKNDANLASSLTGDAQYMGYTIWPRLRSLASALTEFFLPEFAGTEGWWFAYENPVREDRSAMVIEIKSLTDGGLMTGNEARSVLGLDDGGEELDMLRYNGQPLRMEPEEEPGDEDGPDEEKPEPEPEEEPVKEPADEKAVAPALVVKEFSPWLTDAVNAALEVLNSDLARWYIVLWAIAQRDMAALAGPVTAAQADAIVGRVLEDHREELERVLAAGIRRAYISSGPEAAAAIGGQVDVATFDAAAATYARERGAELVVDISETVRKAVGEAIAKGIDEGRSPAEVMSELRSMGFGASRAETIARTETIFARDAAARGVWKAAGVEGKRWLTAGNPCPFCSAISGEHPNALPIDTPYYRAGDSVTAGGGTITFAHDVQGPPAHPNCVCRNLPERTISAEATP